ncbi:MAG: DNA-directed RNA polymerase subunit omega [Pelagibacteraceae bacterium]|jgi:DNA-directed RNA polymerase subunit omega|nr:DNA-directed RNA polymerase subunit omega [Pelagibacteraceae bacterium]
MARITVEDCLKKVESQYDLVLLAKERTSQLNSGAEMLVEADNDKNTVISLREIGDGKVSVEELKNNSIARLRKEPDENFEEEEAEEVFDDDFEKQYKGEVSKSGVAILPSKRMRKIPFNTSVSTKDKVSKEKEKPLELIEEVEEKK